MYLRHRAVAPAILAGLFCAAASGSAGAAPAQRVWKVEDPLYRELLSGRPPGLQRSGAIYWLHTYMPSVVPAFAREYGVRYSNEEALKELADAKLLAIVQTGTLDKPFVREMADRYGYRVLLVPDIMHWTAPDAPKVGSASFVLDPRSKAAYFADLRTALGKYRKYIWGIYTGDELTESAVHQAVSLYIEHRQDYPYIRQVNEEVRTRFGFGVYGMPESVDDPVPYRWIAMRRWVNNELVAWQKEVYTTVHAMAPEVKVISMDPVACHKPVGFDRMAPYFDIATQQLYPWIDQNRQQFGFTTKMVVDLTGKPTWPCTHVENYSFSTTLEEVKELLSQVMRNGGTGFHYWLCDEQGNQATHGFMLATKWGFPERWRALCELNLLNGRMNEVAIPADPDAAMLYSEDYYQSFSEKEVPYPYVYPYQPEWAYTFFGPVARTWFRFVNDNIVEDRKTDLSRYRAIIVPAAKYERRSVVDRLAKYTSSGGTLVVGDPTAFTTDVNGASLASVRGRQIAAACAPGKRQTTLKFGARCSMRRLRNRQLKVTGPAYALTPVRGAEVMARFADGSPAVLRNRVGKGSVIVFAANPFAEAGIANREWKSFFVAFAKDLRLKTGRNIWRFQFPAYRTVHQPAPTGTCLTGNYIKWWQDGPVDVQNARLAGSYSYSVPPDAIGDRGDPAAIAFQGGKLTDRTRAYGTPKTKLAPSDFVVSWKTAEPVDITFDLQRTCPVSRVSLWYSDELAPVTVLGSTDGRAWSPLAKLPRRPMKDRDDVLAVSLPLKAGSRARYVRLSFGERAPGSAMTLVECEIWGTAKPMRAAAPG